MHGHRERERERERERDCKFYLGASSTHSTESE